jgi:hypothetical protein
MAQRGITCPCGHEMKARTDLDLYRVVRDHVDRIHPELGYSREDIERLIRTEAYDKS